MPNTFYHLALNYVVYRILVLLKVIKKGDYHPLWMMFSSNIIDLDHLLRVGQYLEGGEVVYGMNLYLFHGWWSIFPISALMLLKRYRWFAIGWALHLSLDLIMVFFGLNTFLLPR